MIEPYYNKVKDFGVEFYSDAEGVHYAGLSVFHTVNGAYLGNSLADEMEKRSILSTYISEGLLNDVIISLEQLLTSHLRGVYRGPLGVDMMIVAAEKGFYASSCCRNKSTTYDGTCSLIFVCLGRTS